MERNERIYKMIEATNIMASAIRYIEEDPELKIRLRSLLKTAGLEKLNTSNLNAIGTNISFMLEKAE